jgi:hypothetical protein
VRGVHDLAALLKVGKSLHQSVNSLPDDWRKTSYGSFGEEWVEGCSSRLVEIVRDGGKHGVVHAEGEGEPRVLVSLLGGGRAGVEVVVEVGRMYVELIGGDADDGAIFGVEFCNFESVLARVGEEVVVELVPGGLQLPVLLLNLDAEDEK